MFSLQKWQWEQNDNIDSKRTRRISKIIVYLSFTFVLCNFDETGEEEGSKAWLHLYGQNYFAVVRYQATGCVSKCDIECSVLLHLSNLKITTKKTFFFFRKPHVFLQSMPFFSQNGHFEALKTNVTVQFKARNMYSGTETHNGKNIWILY